MRVHRDEGVANHIGPESCAGPREGVGEALTGVRTGQPLSRERTHFRVPTRLKTRKARVHRGAYRALPSRRKFITNGDGHRPLGVAALEDKIVQRAVVEVLNAVYEEDFLGFSYGFRPGRSQHDALDALAFGITRTKVNYILDCDVRSFFDSVSHDWLVRFVEHRTGDPRMIRLIRKWLKAGVVEDGEWSATETRTPRGSVVSPTLANVYLHYCLDLWAERWRHRTAPRQRHLRALR